MGSLNGWLLDESRWGISCGTATPDQISIDEQSTRNHPNPNPPIIFEIPRNHNIVVIIPLGQILGILGCSINGY